MVRSALAEKSCSPPLLFGVGVVDVEREGVKERERTLSRWVVNVFRGVRVAADQIISLLSLAPPVARYVPLGEMARLRIGDVCPWEPPVVEALMRTPRV